MSSVVKTSAVTSISTRTPLAFRAETSLAVGAIESAGLRKSYPGVQALKGVNFAVAAGEVRALLGKNGAGKSTLVKILSGAEAPDAGTLKIGGRRIDIFAPGHANARGIATVHQELSLVPELSVAENILLGRWRSHRRGWFIDQPAVHREAAAVLAEFGAQIDPAAKVRKLSIAQQQLVEIARGLSFKPRVLILDEPTSSLPASEVEILLRTIGVLSDRGVAVVYVSHRMDEIQRIAHSVTVLRDGRHIDTLPIAAAPTAEIVRLMTGEASGATPRKRAQRPPGDIALKVRGLTTVTKLGGLSFEVRQGEIVGLAGLLGSGRTELLRAVYGLDPVATGRIEIFGKGAADRSPRAMIRRGVGLAPEDRKKEGLVLDMSISENLVLSSMQKIVHGVALLSYRRQSQLSQRAASRMSVKLASLLDPVRTLSGGNQQKVVLGKCLNADVKVLLLDEPTRGVDIEAKHQIYELLEQLAAQGTAVLVASSEMEELMLLCDRLLLMKDGKIVGERSVAQTDLMAVVMGTTRTDSRRVGR
ncbi:MULTISPECIES: sugar ABC transporter ATP-binding protein [unclassified Bradyrhizobium]|uniref:sugar ABC transporter ATP-binding protein n=1 Tax=unclassified Bradyrhizobium TaxID=2631580 RepID=UPI002FF39444